MATMEYEKLGAFYLGKLFDQQAGEVADDLLLYDAKDLTTHAVCVGMTGSGKTGLCVCLLEEAAIDGIPAIAVDPKGDLANLLLTFPKLRPEDFRPWIDPAEASRKGQSVDEYAEKTSDMWRNGLESWGQDGKRIEHLKSAAEMRLYTPGSSAGLELSILKSFAAPPADLLSDEDALREKVLGTVSGLLSLLGIDADPIRSREHILLSNILEHSWRAGADVDLPSMIRSIQKPPFTKVGVFDLESFYPSKDRMELAMTLNNLLASPSFAAWMEGEPLDIGRLLYSPEGKPRLSILYIAHLSEAERMFFVTLLLNEVLTWVRSQPGTSSLRALLYMDEVFGYFPPVANPPSKKPMLTLLKQARAYGLGVVLATQNPVDLDYKGLSNTGTWLLGRLQTERDKARVLEGLEGASVQAGASFDKAKVEATLAGLDSRVFLMNNVHEDEPVLFHTRWAMSYLRGPLTREQIQVLAGPMKDAAAAEPEAAGAASAPAPVAATTEEAPARPVLPPEVKEQFYPLKSKVPPEARVQYRPALLGKARLHYVKSSANIDKWQEVALLAPLGEQLAVDIWGHADELAPKGPRLKKSGLKGAQFAVAPPEAAKARQYQSWGRQLKEYLYQTRRISLYSSPALKLKSRAGESQGAFAIRVRQAAREKRDAMLEKLHRTYDAKRRKLEDKIHRAEMKLSDEKSQYSQQKLQTAITVGSTVLGALFGRKKLSRTNVRGAGTAARSMGRASRQKGDIKRAKKALENAKDKLMELEFEMSRELDDLKLDLDWEHLEITIQELPPRKSDITVAPVALVWLPWVVDEDGTAQPGWGIKA